MACGLAPASSASGERLWFTEGDFFRILLPNFLRHFLSDCFEIFTTILWIGHKCYIRDVQHFLSFFIAFAVFNKKNDIIRISHYNFAAMLSIYCCITWWTHCWLLGARSTVLLWWWLIEYNGLQAAAWSFSIFLAFHRLSIPRVGLVAFLSLTKSSRVGPVTFGLLYFMISLATLLFVAVVVQATFPTPQHDTGINAMWV